MGCKSGKETVRKGGKVGNKKTIEIVEKVQQVEANKPRSLSFKMAVSIKNEESTTSLRASVRMVRDSVIWLSITAHSYEVIRLVATIDSIKYVNRPEKNYYLGNYDFIEEKLGISFGFNQFQSLLLARSFGLDAPENINKRNDKNYYVLSSLNKHQLKKMEKGKNTPLSDSEVLFTNWVNPETFQVEKVSLMEVNSKNKATIQYMTFDSIDVYTLLTSFKMQVLADKNMEVSAQISKYNLNIPLKFPFKISSKYEQIIK